MPITSNAICNKAVQGIFDSMLCAGLPQGGVDACVGDAGGPLLVFDDESQSWRLAGITSFGAGQCAAAGTYGVYTRVDSYNNLISQTICTPEATPSTPTLNLTTQGSQVTIAWSKVNNASGYRLFYAPIPALNPIGSIDVQQTTGGSVNLPKGGAFYVAVQAYNGKCLSGYSNIRQVVIK